MRFAHAMYALGALLVLAGCGGSGSSVNERGEVSGLVFDETGTVVRGARVYVDSSHETSSNVGGIYQLGDVPANNIIVKAEITKDGVTYRGQNLASVSVGERAKDVNIAVFPSNEIASLKGTVRDRQGRLLTGMRIFLLPTDDSIPTSSVGITDNNGFFRVGGLHSGTGYRVQVNGLGFDSDFDTVNLSAGEDRYVEFTAPDQPGDGVPRPQNLFASAYTTPNAVRSDARQGTAMEAMKRILNPKRAQRASTRLTTGGNRIEVDLFWDRPTTTDDQTALLGYAIYRGTSDQNLTNTDFLRDPQASFFADLNDSLIENRNYTYGITALDTLYDGSEGESGLSNTVNVTAIGDQRLGSVDATTKPTFTWPSAPGASKYLVYIFDEYPTIGVTERFLSNSVSGNSFSYNDTPLGVGRTFYYVIVGANADETSFSISPVGQFTVH